jgi:hypothetical protein
MSRRVRALAALLVASFAFAAAACSSPMSPLTQTPAGPHISQCGTSGSDTC